MYTSLLESLKQWNKTHDERVKLQYAYFTLIIVLVVTAGLVSLLNVDLGRKILALGSMTAVVFLINAVAWALLQSFVLSRLASTRRTTKK